MPRLKPTEAEMMDRRTRAVLASLKEENALDDEQMGKAMGRTKRTFQNRMKTPGDFTLDELRCIIRALHPTDAEIVKMIGGRA